MIVFEDIQDVEEWLAPFDLAAFWEAVEPWEIFTGEDRAHYEGMIAHGTSSKANVLSCLKTLARLDLQMRFGLTDRLHEPTDAQYLRRTH